MKIIRNSIIPFGRRYVAINIFGVLFLKRDVEVTTELLNHEQIHTAQMRELLYIPFYLIYVAEWIVRVISCEGNLHKAYRSLSFEREAYDNESDPQYLNRRPSFVQWRKERKIRD